MDLLVLIVVVIMLLVWLMRMMKVNMEMGNQIMKVKHCLKERKLDDDGWEGGYTALHKGFHKFLNKVGRGN